MKNLFFKHFIYLLFLALTFNSCQKEFEINEKSTTFTQDFEVINNRFYFSSKSGLESKINELESKSKEEVESFFKEKYKNGFRSYTPIVNSNDQELMELLYKTYENSDVRTSGDELEGDEEELIYDPYLAAIVNDKKQLVVNDTLYQLSDKGVFFSHIQDSTYLFDYMEESMELYEEIDIVSERLNNSGVNEISEKVYRFVAPIDEDIEDYPGGGAGGDDTGGGSGGSYSPVTDPFQTIINNLPNCEGSGNWFQNLFGTSYWCTSYWDDRHRVKTEFWSQRWFVYASSGVLTKSQTRRFRVWWASEADEIHLGINRILLKYNYPIPDINYLSHPPVNGRQRPIYMYNGTFKVKQDYIGNYFVDSNVQLVDSSLPFFEFENEDLLNIYIPKIPLLGTEYQLNLTTQDITSQANINKLYQMGIDFLQGFLGSSVKEFAVTHQKNDNEIVVIYFGEDYHNSNDNMLKRRFYQDVSFKISATWNDSSSGGWSYDVAPADELFRNYTHYELDFYGLAKRFGTWKGNRLVRN